MNSLELFVIKSYLRAKSFIENEDGSLIEFLGSNGISLIVIGIVLVALVALFKDIVLVEITNLVKSTFGFKY